MNAVVDHGKFQIPVEGRGFDVIPHSATIVPLAAARFDQDQNCQFLGDCGAV